MSILLTRFRFHTSINKWNLKFRRNLETSSFQTSSSFGKLLLIRRSFETSSFKEEVLRFRFLGESWMTQTEPFCEPSLVSFPHSNQDTNTNDIGVKKDSQRTKANNNQQNHGGLIIKQIVLTLLALVLWPLFPTAHWIHLFFPTLSVDDFVVVVVVFISTILTRFRLKFESQKQQQYSKKEVSISELTQSTTKIPCLVYTSIWALNCNGILKLLLFKLLLLLANFFL